MPYKNPADRAAYEKRRYHRRVARARAQGVTFYALHRERLSGATRRHRARKRGEGASLRSIAAAQRLVERATEIAKNLQREKHQGYGGKINVERI